MTKFPSAVIDGMTFDEAVSHVRSTKGAAFSYVTKGEPPRWGEIFMLTYELDHDSEPDDYAEYYLHYAAGTFRSSSGEADSFWPEEIPESARALKYLKCENDTGILEFETQIAILRLLDPSAEIDDD